MSLCLPELCLLLRKAPVCCFYHVQMPMGKSRASSLCPTGCCPGSSLLFFAPPLTRLCRRSSRVSVLRQHHGGTDSFLFPMSMAKIKPWDRQLFSLLVVQLETTRSRSTWFRFSVFLQLTRTICSSNFGISLRITDLPPCSPDSQINSLGFKTNSENSAQQWHAVQCFRLFLQLCEGMANRLLEKKI